jgi:transcriptional regulator with XRE-family HTH domain
MIPANQRKVFKERALKEFGKNFAKLRKEKNLSLRQVSQSCNLDNSKIAKIEKGMINISLTTLLELSDGLDVDPQKLLDCKFQ